MSPRAAAAGEINGDLVDRFTLLHLASGVALGLVGATPSQALAVGAAWEVLERALKESIPEAFPHPSQDSIENATVDTLAVWLGCALARRRGRR